MHTTIFQEEKWSVFTNKNTPFFHIFFKILSSAIYLLKFDFITFVQDTEFLTDPNHL